jgi:hypothetical protein
MGPAIGGVRDQALQHGEHRTLGSRGAQLHPPQERRRVLEPGHLGEESTDLELRMGAGLEPAEQLQDRRIAVADRGIGLLGARAARRRVGERIAVRRERRRPPADDARLAPASGLGQKGEQAFGEARVVEGVDQDRRPAVVAELGDPPARRGLAVGRNREGQEIMLRLASRRCHAQEGEDGVGDRRRERDQLQDLDLGPAGILGRVPAAASEIARQDARLEGASRVLACAREPDALEPALLLQALLAVADRLRHENLPCPSSRRIERPGRTRVPRSASGRAALLRRGTCVVERRSRATANGR